MLNFKLFQICFEKSQFQDVKGPFVPFDNTDNEFPELREFHCFRKAAGWPDIDWEDPYRGFAKLDAWGFFGPRWEEKLKYPGEEINRTIIENANYDVWIFNHARIVSCLTLNVWEHGDIFHPGISMVARALLKIMGYDPRVVDFLMTEKNTCYCSYFVAKHQFWKDYLQFLIGLSGATLELPAKEREIFLSSAAYVRDKSLNLFPFIVERMFSTFLLLRSLEYNVYSKKVDFFVYGEKLKNSRETLESLSRLKSQIVLKKSDDLLKVWHDMRTSFLQDNPNILNLD